MTTAANSLSLAELKILVHDPAAATKQLSGLLSALEDPNEEHRAWASDCLQLIAAPAELDWELLCDRCMDECEAVASWACKLLGRTHQAALQPRIVQVLSQHTSLAVRQQAALSLESLGALTDEARAALIAATSCTDPRLKRLAQQTLDKHSHE